MIADINTLYYFQSVPKLLNFSPSSAPFCIKGTGCGVLIDVWCVCSVRVHACRVQGVSTSGDLCCSLLWCNTGATDKSELMNGKLLLMIVKMLLSPHVVLGHLSATEMDLQAPNTFTHITHANQLLSGSRGNQLQNLLPCAPLLFLSCSLSYIQPFAFMS